MRISVIVLFLYVSFSGSTVSAQVLCKARGDAAASAIKEDVRNALHLGDETLFASRREDLETDLLELQYIVKSTGSKPTEQVSVREIEVLEIRRQGLDVENGKFAHVAVNVDDAPMWRVAYDCQSEKVFHLYGFPDPKTGFNDSKTGFNELMRQLSLTVDSESLVLVLQSSFVKLTYDDSLYADVRSELDLMKAAINDYARRPRTDNAFMAFWHKCPAQTRHQVTAPAVSAVGQDFRVTFYTDVDRTVYKNVIEVTREGQITSLESKPLFVWPN